MLTITERAQQLSKLLSQRKSHCKVLVSEQTVYLFLFIKTNKRNAYDKVMCMSYEKNGDFEMHVLFMIHSRRIAMQIAAYKTEGTVIVEQEWPKYWKEYFEICVSSIDDESEKGLYCNMMMVLKKL